VLTVSRLKPDKAFHQTARQRQALFSIRWVVHSLSMIFVIGERALHWFNLVIGAVVFINFRLQFFDDIINSALPDACRPTLVDRLRIFNNACCAIRITQRVHEIEDAGHVRKVTLVNGPVHSGSV